MGFRHKIDRHGFGGLSRRQSEEISLGRHVAGSDPIRSVQNATNHKRVFLLKAPILIVLLGACSQCMLIISLVYKPCQMKRRNLASRRKPWPLQACLTQHLNISFDSTQRVGEGALSIGTSRGGDFRGTAVRLFDKLDTLSVACSISSGVSRPPRPVEGPDCGIAKAKSLAACRQVCRWARKTCCTCKKSGNLLLS